MSKMNFRYQPMYSIDTPQAGHSAISFLNPFALKSDSLRNLKHAPFSAPSFHIDLDKKLDVKLSLFEEKRTLVKDTSLALDERARTVEKKRVELETGINMLPNNLPEEFQYAVNVAVASAKESLINEANEIASQADTARCETNNTLYEIRREQEKLEKTVHRFGIICSIPFIKKFGIKRYDKLYSKNEQLLEISHDTSCHYERLLYNKNLLFNLCR